MKYINTVTGNIFSNDNEYYVLQLIKDRPHFKIYEEPVQEEEPVIIPKTKRQKLKK